MSENEDETKDEQQDAKSGDSGVGISDDQLPEDLVPSEDNPLAEGLPPGETVDDDLLGGGQSDDDAGDGAGDDADGLQTDDEQSDEG